MDTRLQITKAKQILRGDLATPDENNRNNKLPHFEIDISVDGVQIFDNSEQSECLPICMVVHSVCESSDASVIAPVVLKTRHPIVIGVAHCKHKPNVRKFLEPLVKELFRLDPDRNDYTTVGRQFTVSIRCVIADWPMRSYLKAVKSHSGYWSCERCIQKGIRYTVRPSRKGQKSKETIQFRELNAPPRTDEDFLTYTVSDECDDSHLNNLNDLSPFIDLNFRMVSGFVIDPMHTFYAGCVGSRFQGIAYKTGEGKLSYSQLAQVDARLKLFELCKPFEFDRFLRSLVRCAKKFKHHELRDAIMYLVFPVFRGILPDDKLENLLLLQQAMLLMGGFNFQPVPISEALEAKRVLKLFVQQLIDFGYPIKPTTHAVIHMPDDVINFNCGVENLSAFVFENFYRVFRNILRSGNKPLEQIRNRLVERSKYLLPTTADGMIMNSFEQFKLEVKKCEAKNSNKKIVLDFTVTKGLNGLKKLTFPNFVLSNKFPNNVCILKNKDIVVCQDIIEYPLKSNIFLIIGIKWKVKENAFSVPFLSSDHSIYVVSKLDNRIGEWNVNCIAAKMYALPYKLTDYKVLPDISCTENPCEWFVTPIRHTLK